MKKLIVVFVLAVAIFALSQINTGNGGLFTSFSGDGTLITNSGSTGAVTVTLGSLPSGFTGVTATSGDNTTKVATTAFVTTATNAAGPMFFPFQPDNLTANVSSLFNNNNTNQARLIGVIWPASFSTTKVCYEVGSTADNTANTYDIGIYTGSAGGSGTLIGHTGAIAGTSFAPSTNFFNCINWSGGSFTIPKGRVYVALTFGGVSGQATLFGNSTNASLSFAANVNVTAGGTLNTGVTLPADANSGAGLNINSCPWLSFQ